MTPAERAFWLKVQRKAAALEPEIARALLRAFAILRESMSATEMERLVASGNVEEAVRRALAEDILDRAFLPVRDRIRKTVEQGFTFSAKDVRVPAALKGQTTFAFDWLNPRVIDAVRTLDTKVMHRLRDDARETVRAFIENGLRDGVNPRTIGRGLREVIGLAPNQEEAVRHFTQALTSGDFAKARGYQLRDKRFDGTLRRLAKDGQPLTSAQVESMTAAYRRRFLAWNAETNARTATLDSLKTGQRLAWQDAADMGLVDMDRMMKRWSGVLDDRERPEHVAMEGETVPMDDHFSNGEMTPGESTFNCRCIAVYFERRGSS